MYLDLQIPPWLVCLDNLAAVALQPFVTGWFPSVGSGKIKVKEEEDRNGESI